MAQALQGAGTARCRPLSFGAFAVAAGQSGRRAATAQESQSGVTPTTTPWCGWRRISGAMAASVASSSSTSSA